MGRRIPKDGTRHFPKPVSEYRAKASGLTAGV